MATKRLPGASGGGPRRPARSTRLPKVAAPPPDMAPDERAKRQEAARLDYEMFRQETSDRLKYQVDFAQSTIRGLTIVNGGALIALFTFIGNTGARFDPSPLWWAFALFGCGLAGTLGAAIAAGFSQGSFMIAKFRQALNAQAIAVDSGETWDFETPYYRAQRWEIAGIAAAVIAFCCFIAGSGLALKAVL